MAKLRQTIREEKMEFEEKMQEEQRIQKEIFTLQEDVEALHFVVTSKKTLRESERAKVNETKQKWQAVRSRFLDESDWVKFRDALWVVDRALSRSLSMFDSCSYWDRRKIESPKDYPHWRRALKDKRFPISAAATPFPLPVVPVPKPKVNLPIPPRKRGSVFEGMDLDKLERYSQNWS
jgi:hypothetical protein